MKQQGKCRRVYAKEIVISDPYSCSVLYGNVIKAIFMHGKVKQLNSKRNISCFSTSFSYQFIINLHSYCYLNNNEWVSSDILKIFL